MANDNERSGRLLQDLADGDLEGIAPLLQDRVRARKASGLDAEAFQLAEIVALAAVDASPIFWFVHLGLQPSVELEKIVGTLIAAAPIIGMPRVVSAAGNIVGVTEIAEEQADDAP